MGKYLDLARAARRPEPRPEPTVDVRMNSPEVRKLLSAGWEPKERCGKIIWKRPDDGFYCSQEAALHFLNRAISSTRYKSGADGEG